MRGIKKPLAALIQVERRLRGVPDAYHLATDNKGDEGLGQWMKRCIRAAKKGRA